MFENYPKLIEVNYMQNFNLLIRFQAFTYKNQYKQEKNSKINLLKNKTFKRRLNCDKI